MAWQKMHLKPLRMQKKLGEEVIAVTTGDADNSSLASLGNTELPKFLSIGH